MVICINSLLFRCPIPHSLLYLYVDFLSGAGGSSVPPGCCCLFFFFFVLGGGIYVCKPKNAPIWHILMSLERRRFHFFYNIATKAISQPSLLKHLVNHVLNSTIKYVRLLNVCCSNSQTMGIC